MYHKDLVNDLKKIFGLKKVVFSSVEYGAEQDVIFCDITTERNRPRHGYYYFRVTGQIGFNAQYENTKKGWFHYKWLSSRYENKDRFQLGGNETNATFTLMNKFFCKSRIDFVYTIKIPFDPSKKTKGFIATITSLFTKGGK